MYLLPHFHEKVPNSLKFSLEEFTYNSCPQKIPAGFEIIQEMLLKYNNHAKNGFNFYVRQFCKNINARE